MSTDHPFDRELELDDLRISSPSRYAALVDLLLGMLDAEPAPDEGGPDGI